MKLVGLFYTNKLFIRKFSITLIDIKKNFIKFKIALKKLFKKLLLSRAITLKNFSQIFSRVQI